MNNCKHASLALTSGTLPVRCTRCKQVIHTDDADLIKELIPFGSNTIGDPHEFDHVYPNRGPSPKVESLDW